MNERLAVRWKNLVQAFSENASPGTIVGWFNIIVDLYGAPNRTYHNLAHIDRLLELWYSDTFFTSGRAREEDFMGRAERAKVGHLLEVAIWFHDVIYKPGVAGNEKASSDMMKNFLSTLNASETDIEIVDEAIMATTYERKPPTKMEELFHRRLSDDRKNMGAVVTGYLTDLDLSGLAAPYDDFSRESAAIREEFGLVPDEAFAWGRSRFFINLLATPIYTVAKHLEAPAKSNIKRHIIELLSSIA